MLCWCFFVVVFNGGGGGGVVVVGGVAAVNDTPDTPKLPTGKAAGCDCAQAACIALHAESAVWQTTSKVTCNGQHARWCLCVYKLASARIL